MDSAILTFSPEFPHLSQHSVHMEKRVSSLAADLREEDRQEAFTAPADTWLLCVTHSFLPWNPQIKLSVPSAP